MTENPKLPDFLHFHCIKQPTWTRDSLKQVTLGPWIELLVGYAPA